MWFNGVKKLSECIENVLLLGINLLTCYCDYLRKVFLHLSYPLFMSPLGLGHFIDWVKEQRQPLLSFSLPFSVLCHFIIPDMWIGSTCTSRKCLHFLSLEFPGHYLNYEVTACFCVKSRCLWHKLMKSKSEAYSVGTDWNASPEASLFGVLKACRPEVLKNWPIP